MHRLYARSMVLGLFLLVAGCWLTDAEVASKQQEDTAVDTGDAEE